MACCSEFPVITQQFCKVGYVNLTDDQGLFKEHEREAKGHEGDVKEHEGDAKEHEGYAKEGQGCSKDGRQLFRSASVLLP